MSTKHIFPSPDGLVSKSLRGAVSLNPTLRFHPASKTVYVHSPSQTTRVAVVSGGGAGHEPAHAGATGRGMLTASVSGEIFASPSTKQISTALRLAAFSCSPQKARDVLVIINNYTGDRLNFGLAIEKARTEGLNVESVVVADDTSLAKSTSLVGPRGLAGNILACKLLGALAESGADLYLVKSLGDAIVANLASIGTVLEPCHIPGHEGDDVIRLPADQIGFGCGLHNEPAAKKQMLGGVEDLIGDMLNHILQSKDTQFVQEGQEIVLFANNLGGISQLEMTAILDEVVLQLRRKNIFPLRVYASSYMTSLNAVGFSLTLLNITCAQVQTETKTTLSMDICQLLDDPTDAVGWIGAQSHWPQHGLRDPEKETEETELLVETFSTQQSTSSSSNTDFWKKCDISPHAVKNGIVAACSSVIAAESELTEYDTVVGDGDCGATFKAGATAVKQAIEDGSLAVAGLDPSGLSEAIADIVQDAMGGTMGALLAILFTSAARSLRNATTSADILRALQTALDDLALHTPAQPGDRTMIDTLRPFCNALKDGLTGDQAIEAGRRGAEATRDMKPRLGRATYVGLSEGTQLPPDPGALGVLAILEGYIRGYRA